MDSLLENYFGIIEQPEEQWDLFSLSLELSRLLHPHLQVETYWAYRKELVGAARVGTATDLYSAVERVNLVLFENEGFAGDTDTYYDPRNSFMASVIDRRKGIPITLSILYRSVADEIGLPLDWISMPGHFLLRCRDASRPLFLDAFQKGRLLLPEECLAMLESLGGNDFEPRQEYLAPTGNRQVLLRMLLNLKQIYRKEGATEMHLHILDARIPVLLDPLAEILERGLLKISLARYHEGLRDLDHFLEHSNNEEMKSVVQEQMDRIRKLVREVD